MALTRRQFVGGLAGVATMGAETSEDTLIAALALDRPEMSAVRAAQERGDRAGARAAFARHLRTRAAPAWYFDPAAPPKDFSAGDREKADGARAHTFEVVGVRHTFGPKIDWTYNPTAQPDSPVARNHEWTWQLNRHSEWGALARAYSATGDANYARELARQLTDWVRENPVPTEKADNGPHSRWRTIEAGIRMFGVWPTIYHHLVRQPEVFPDEALLTLVESMRQHAEYLSRFQTTGNWLIMEQNGLFHVAVLFPEFKEASRWRTESLNRLRSEMDVQIYPDGTQYELSPGYHNGMIGHFVGALRLSRMNGLPLPPGYAETLERMFDALFWAMSPDRDVPHLNDSWAINVPNRLREGLTLFPHRKDWAFIASDGREGEAPKTTSYRFPYAGWLVMRSGWDRDARFLLMDAGPFGYGHQHEDKLSFVLNAYGSRLVFDAGSYAYDNSPMRAYVLSARGHNVIHVDGREQRRRGLKNRLDYVTKTPVPLTWKSTADFDYAAAAFGVAPEEGWGDEKDRTVVHTRRVLFVKPDYWVVLDTLTPSDTAEHMYESTFHLDAPAVAVDAATRQVTTKRPEEANLAVLPLAEPGLSVRVVEGQETPVVQGWLPKKHGVTGADPRPTVCYTRRARGPVHFLYVFAPAPAGKPFPVTAVTAAPGDGAVLAASVATSDGPKRVALMPDDALWFGETRL